MNKSNAHRRWNLRIFGGSSHPELTRLVARKSGVKVGDALLGKFANKETQVQIKENVRGQNIFIIQTAGVANPHDHMMELLFLVNACRLAAAQTITVVMPLYFYGKSDSKDCYRMSITGKLFANMLKKAGVDSVMILDSHTPQIEGFFDMPVDNLKIEPLFCHWIRKNIIDYRECVVTCPDAVGVKRVIMIADDLDVDYAVINCRQKHRKDIIRSQYLLEKRHPRLNHQHLSDNWHLVEMEHAGEHFVPDNSGDTATVENNIDKDREVFQNEGEVSDNLSLEQAIFSSPGAENEAPECDVADTREQNYDSDYSTEAVCLDSSNEQHDVEYERKVSVERKIRNSTAGRANPSSPRHTNWGNFYCNENEEHEVIETRVSGNVEGKAVILIDDVIDTGRQLKSAVQAIKNAGGRCIYILATHGVFSAEALATINSLDQDFVKSVHVTNSIPQEISKSILNDRLGIIDVSALIAEIIRRHHYCESVSVVGGEFNPIDFKQNPDDSRRIMDLASGTHVNNAAIGELGIHRSPPNSVFQEESASVVTNRPLERVRRGYRLNSKCWD